MKNSDPPVLSGFTRSLAVALGERDRSTRLHSERVVRLSLELGRDCELARNELEILGIGAHLHDIGKIGIPDRVLQKPAPFVEDEWETMKQHPVIGERILLSLGDDRLGEAAAVVRHHHEHFDGSGYPDRLTGNAIPLYSRMISLADSYDAIAITRPYHKARHHSAIMDILEAESGVKHDPELLRRFCRVIEGSELRAPVGSA